MVAVTRREVECGSQQGQGNNSRRVSESMVFFCLVIEHQGNNTSELYVNGVSLISSTSLKQAADKNKISPNLSNYIFFQMLRRDEKRCFRYGIIALCSIFFLFAIYSPVYQPSSQREGEFLNPSYFGNVVYTLLALLEN